MILESMMLCDGMLIGAPSYWGGVPAQTKNLFDRSMAIEMGFHLRNKVGGGLTIAAERHGGHEGTVDEIHRWMFIHDMIVVGVGPERPKTSIGGHIGAMAVQGFPFPTHSDGTNSALSGSSLRTARRTQHTISTRTATSARASRISTIAR